MGVKEDRQGKCDHCKLCFRWDPSFMKLKSAACPRCGLRLSRTTYLKQWQWVDERPIHVLSLKARRLQLDLRIHPEGSQ